MQPGRGGRASGLRREKAKLFGASQLAAGNVAEGEARAAQVMAGEVRGVAVAVHVADGGSEAVQTLDDLVVLVHHLHVVVAADAAGSCEEPRRAFDSVERAVLDREQQFFALAELFVDSLVAVSVVSLNGFERLRPLR